MEKKKSLLKKLRLGVCVAAFVAAISVFAVLLQIEESVLARYERGIVCMAAKDIPRGLVITEENCAEYFKLEETDKKCISSSVLADYGQLYGLVPVFDVEEGTLVTYGMFEAVNDIVGGMKEPVIAGFKADDLYQVAGGVLRAGDRIHIFNVSDTGEATLGWENVYVESVFDQSGKAIASGDNTTSAQRINVYMDKADMEAFYSGLASGSLRVVKVYK